MENQINMTKEQRAALMDRIDVLNRVKALMLLPGLCMITMKQAAAYFEVSVECIRKCLARHGEELKANGAVTLIPSEVRERLRGQDVQLAGQMVCINDEHYFELPNRGCRFFTPRAMLNLAMLLSESKVAQEVRNQLLNIVEMTSAADRVAPIENEQEMLADIGRAYATGDLTAFAAASSKYSGYLNRNLAAATAQINTLNTEKAALSEVNAMLSEGAMVWEPRQTLNALIRAIAASAFDHKYSAAWDRFYRELKYRTGILIAQRRGVRGGKPPLDAIREDEWPKLLKVAASLCYDYCVDVVYATNEETVRAYNLDTIETEFGVRKNRGTVVVRPASNASAAAAV